MGVARRAILMVVDALGERNDMVFVLVETAYSASHACSAVFLGDMGMAQRLRVPGMGDRYAAECARGCRDSLQRNCNQQQSQQRQAERRFWKHNGGL